MKKVLRTCALVACLAAGSKAVAELRPAVSADSIIQETSSQCSAAEFRQLDFWIGVWDVRWDATTGQAAGSGTNTITRQLGNCVVLEQFDGGPTTKGLIGHSVSTYHVSPRLWRQTWVDNQGGYFALTGGPAEGGRFILENTRLSENAPYLRMVFEKISADSLTWRWQRSRDKGVNWDDAWVIYYTRRN